MNLRVVPARPRLSEFFVRILHHVQSFFLRLATYITRSTILPSSSQTSIKDNNVFSRNILLHLAHKGCINSTTRKHEALHHHYLLKMTIAASHHQRKSIVGLAHPADRRNSPAATTRGTSKSVGYTPKRMPTRSQQKSVLSGVLDGPRDLKNLKIPRRKAKQPKFASATDRTRLSIMPDNKPKIIIRVPVPDAAVDKFGWADFPILQQRFSVPPESLRAPSSS
jgi:hypothetical protein